jgi:hypothetical protein
MTTTTTDIDLDRLDSDAQAQIPELEQQEARLALDALTNPAMAEELKMVQSRRASALAQRRQVAMAREERDRQEVDAQRQAEAKVREKAKAEADRCERELGTLAASVDAAASAYAAAVADYARVFAQREEALVAAGLREWGRGSQPGGLGAALRFHLHAAGALRHVTVSDPGAGPDRPLAGDGKKGD